MNNEIKDLESKEIFTVEDLISILKAYDRELYEVRLNIDHLRANLSDESNNLRDGEKQRLLREKRTKEERILECMKGIRDLLMLPSSSIVAIKIEK